MRVALAVERSARGCMLALQQCARARRLGRAVAPRDWFSHVSGTYRAGAGRNPPYMRRRMGIGRGDVAVYPHMEPPARSPYPRPPRPPSGAGGSRKIVRGAARYLAPDGVLLMEIAPHQKAALAALAHGAGLRLQGVARDLAGRERVLILGRA